MERSFHVTDANSKDVHTTFFGDIFERHLQSLKNITKFENPNRFEIALPNLLGRQSSITETTQITRCEVVHIGIDGR